MTNTEKFNTSYSDLVNILYKFTDSLSHVGNTNDIKDEDLKLLSGLANTLYTMGKTSVLEMSEMPQNDNININEKEVDKNVDKSGNI